MTKHARGTVHLVLAALLASAACHRRESPPEKPRTPTRAAWHVQRGTAPFLIRGALLTLRGMADRVEGNFEIDVADLTRTRGTISVDLASIAMTSFVDAEQNRRQTDDAKRWLEIDEGNRWAKFIVRQIASAEPADLTSGQGSVRKARVHALGELSLHGSVRPLEATLEASVSFEGTTPRYALVRTVDDLHVDLAAFEIRSRDLLRDKVGDTADVALTMALESAESADAGKAVNEAGLYLEK
jgi:hypothetical protein